MLICSIILGHIVFMADELNYMLKSDLDILIIFKNKKYVEWYYVVNCISFKINYLMYELLLLYNDYIECNM